MLSQKTKNRIKILLIIILSLSFFSGFFIGKISSINQSQKNYNLSLLWEVKDILNEKFIDTRIDKTKDITEDDNIWGAISGFVNSLNDPYTSFLPPEENEQLLSDISGEFTGIGMEITNINGYLTVVSPLPGTPSFKAGLRPKDIIIEIDNVDSINMSSSAAVKLIRGEKNTIVSLTVIRPEKNETLEILVTRDLIKIPTVKTYQKDNVFVIKIYSFTEDSHILFLEALNEFIKSKNNKLIIDVRGNPGGHLFSAVYIAGLFLEEDTIILTEDYGEKKESTILRSGDFHNDKKTINVFTDNLKLGILIDEGSASASEILAGTLSDNKKAILLGTTTFGKGTVQELIPLENNTSLKVTIAKWILPTSGWISYKGIFPDIEISISEEEIKKYLENGTFSDEIDPQLNKAIDELNKIVTNKKFNNIIQDRLEQKIENDKKENEDRLKEILNK